MNVLMNRRCRPAHAFHLCAYISLAMFPSLGLFELELRSFRPHHIILMEPDVARIRALEVYTAELSAKAAAMFKSSVVHSASVAVEGRCETKIEEFDFDNEQSGLPPPTTAFELSEVERDTVPFLFGSDIHVSVCRMVSDLTH